MNSGMHAACTCARTRTSYPPTPYLATSTLLHSRRTHRLKLAFESFTLTVIKLVKPVRRRLVITLLVCSTEVVWLVAILAFEFAQFSAGIEAPFAKFLAVDRGAIARHLLARLKVFRVIERAVWLVAKPPEVTSPVFAFALAFAFAFAFAFALALAFAFAFAGG